MLTEKPKGEQATTPAADHAAHPAPATDDLIAYFEGGGG